MFGPKPPISADEFEWMFATFAWLDQTLGKRDRVEGYVTKLSLPSDPALAKAGTVAALFDAVKDAAGLTAWQCRLERGQEKRAQLQTGLETGLMSSKSALGTFSMEGNTPVIHYDPALASKPDALVATFAHELAHLVVHSIGMPPGGAELEEHATDLTAVYLGFGIFLANSARSFSQFSDGAMHGWQSEASGYLSESALVTGLALFEARFGVSDETAGALKDYLRPAYRKAHKYVAKKHLNLPSDLESLDISSWT